jgi:nucleoside-diphosphate-sugar epimerase
VDGTRHVLASALEAGAGRVVYVSSVVAWGDTGDKVRDETYGRQASPPTPYERTKTEAHAYAEALQKQGAPVMMACPGGVHGPGDHATLGDLFRLYVRGLHPPLGIFGEGGRAAVYVDDCAEGIALVAEKGRLGENYIMSAGNLTYREIFEIVNSTPGGMKVRAYMPDVLAKTFCVTMEPVERALGWPITFSAEMARSGASRYFYSGAKAVRELGAAFRDVRQTFLDTLAGERKRAGKE